MKVFTNGAATINGSDFVPVKSVAIDPGIERILSAVGGSFENSYAGRTRFVPIATITTEAIASMLGIVGAAVLAITEGVGGGVQLYLSQLADGSCRETGSKHMKFEISAGALIPRRITASDGALATIDVDVIGTYDGTNNPLTITKDQALPDTAAVQSEAYTVGPLKMAALMSDVQSFTFDFGVKEYIGHQSGEAYARFVAGLQREASLSVDLLDVDALDDTTGLSIGGDETAVTQYLRKIADGGGPVPDATAENIGLTFAKVFVAPQPINAASGSEATYSLAIDPVWNGTDTAVQISTTSAIT